MLAWDYSTSLTRTIPSLSRDLAKYVKSLVVKNMQMFICELKKTHPPNHSPLILSQSHSEHLLLGDICQVLASPWLKSSEELRQSLRQL